jgi:hypothetical protein
MQQDSFLSFDLPAVARKKVSIGFDGGLLSSDAGVLLLRGVEQRLSIATRLAALPRPEPDRPYGGGDAAVADVCDCGGLRGQQRLHDAAT